MILRLFARPVRDARDYLERRGWERTLAQPLGGGAQLAQDIQIRCINRRSRTDPHERISHIGGVNADGSRWKLTLDAAIAGVDAEKWKFWTTGGGKSVWVEKARHNGNPYLKTTADGVHPDNLLALPDCP